MNGQEQKARATAVAQLQAGFKKLENEVTACYALEVESRLKAQEKFKSLFAEMIDTETQWRKLAVKDSHEKLTSFVQSQVGMLAQTYVDFLTLPWWRRWLWCAFGILPRGPRRFDPRMAVAGEEAFVNAHADAPVKAQYHGHKP